MIKAAIVDCERTLQTVIQETLDERLERRIKKRVGSGDFRVCAAHDFAPIFEKAFSIKPRDLAKNNDFLSFVTNSGLKLKDEESLTKAFKKSSVNEVH
jgi:hypothetical protein